MSSTHSPVTPADIEFFTSTGAEVIYGDEILGGTYNIDMFGKFKGKATTAVFPKSTEQVSKILAHCNERKIAIVPHSGNSGVGGGAIAEHGELLLSLKHMNKIRSFDEIAGVAVADSGCTLDNLDQHVQKGGYIVPLDLGAKKRCMIGGNVSTSAGGLRYLRYGSLHGSVLGLEVVLPNGKIIDSLFTLKKDTSGYDIKQLFIGAEGTLGVVTAVAIALAPKPKATQLAVIGLRSFENIQRAFVTARQNLGEIISAFEFWEKRCTQIVVDQLDLPAPLEGDHEFCVMLETRGSNITHDSEKMTHFLDILRAENIIDESVVVSDPEEIAETWKFRWMMALAHGKCGCMHVYDFSLPPKHQYQLLVETKEFLTSQGFYGTPDSPVTDVTIFGHIGDDNIHLQIIVKEFNGLVEEKVDPWLYQWVGERKGSVAAEHGLGIHKGEFLKYSKSDNLIAAMHDIKALFDPNNIMNPDKHIGRA